MLARPEAVAATANGSGPAPPDWLVRVLGGRTALQGALVRAAARNRADAGRVLRAGAAVDALHGATMLAAAVWKPRYRRSAGASAGFAFLSAGLGLAAAR